ncbi:MAG TPA: polymer-forming cytoskeletal protein, partial [Candidatus Dormibacteraeota bacterium]|nr:polymer-forming cytoskeletal protein [Candidatus Dormibacteraeota bacterium]
EKLPVTQVSAPQNGKEPATAPSGPTVLERDDILQGKLVIRGDARIMGKFQGEIECGSELQIGREAEVVANIRGSSVVVAGTVRGNIFVTGRLSMTNTGRLLGDARVGSLVVQEGAIHRGTIEVNPDGYSDPEPPMIHDLETTVAAPTAAPASMERVKKLWGEFF